MTKDRRIFHIDLMEFREMTFDVVNMPKSAMVRSHFPILGKPIEFMSPVLGINNNKLMKYIVLMYDPKSPLRTRIPDLASRKFNALAYAGFEFEDESGTFHMRLIEMAQGGIPEVNTMIFRFASIVSGPDYQFLIGLENSYFNALAQGFDDLKKMKEAEQMRDTMDKYLQRILAGDDSMIIKQDFFDYVLEEKLGLKPEDIAQVEGKTDGIVPKHVNPYGLSQRKHRWLIG